MRSISDRCMKSVRGKIQANRFAGILYAETTIGFDIWKSLCQFRFHYGRFDNFKLIECTTRRWYREDNRAIQIAWRELQGCLDQRTQQFCFIDTVEAELVCLNIIRSNRGLHRIFGQRLPNAIG